MADHIIEHHAIRTALMLAAASAHGQTPDVIADLREEAEQLIGLCVRVDEPRSDVICQWCDDVHALVQRFSMSGAIPESDALRTAAAVLRFRLLVVRRQPVAAASAASASAPKKRSVAASPAKGNQKRVLQFITDHPDIRTTDLISSLSGTLSGRTVKRCLKELGSAGVVQRVEHPDGGVSYRVDMKG